MTEDVKVDWLYGFHDLSLVIRITQLYRKTQVWIAPIIPVLSPFSKGQAIAVTKNRQESIRQSIVISIKIDNINARFHTKSSYQRLIIYFSFCMSAWCMSAWVPVLICSLYSTDLVSSGFHRFRLYQNYLKWLYFYLSIEIYN